MIKPGLICFMMFLLVADALSQTDIKGIWNGRITTTDHDAAGNYIISIEEQKDGVISGKGLLYKPNLYAQAFGLQQFFGTIDENRVTITDVVILDEKTPASVFFLCFKLSNLLYNKTGNVESLKGTWSSNSNSCFPGEIVLTRYSDSITTGNKVPSYILNTLNSKGDRPMFKNTELSPVVLNVKNRHLELELKDYLKTDNDTVSIYLNRKLILNKVGIAKKPLRFDIRLSRRLASNELILYANNLGFIPPNTSLLSISDGEKRHRILIESTLQKSIAIYLKNTPP